MKYLLLTFSFICVVSCGTTTNVKSENLLGYNGQIPKVFGFSTTEELLLSLKSDSNNIVSSVNGELGLWTIIQSSTDHSLWSFTPEGHPAHPSVVQRTPVEKDGQIFIRTEASCNASKTICDELVNSFMQLNKKIRDSFGA